MIVRPRPRLSTLFFILRGSVILQILPRLVLVFLVSASVVWAHRRFPGVIPSFDGAPYALLGIALSVFLGFRNNACYDRWWEARKAWGQLATASRDFGRQTLILEAGDAESRRRLLTLNIAFAHAMVDFLRPETGTDSATSLLPKDLRGTFAASLNGPDLILRTIAADLVAARRGGRVSDIEWQVLDGSVQQMGAMQVACERIKFTPVPFGYTLLLHRTAFLFCLLLPFGFAEVLGWGATIASTLVAYAFFGLDSLGDEMERPFGNLSNDVPIGALATTIEINLREALGETDLPPPPEPVNYVLM